MSNSAPSPCLHKVRTVTFTKPPLSCIVLKYSTHDLILLAVDCTVYIFTSRHECILLSFLLWIIYPGCWTQCVCVCVFCLQLTAWPPQTLLHLLKLWIPAALTCSTSLLRHFNTQTQRQRSSRTARTRTWNKKTNRLGSSFPEAPQQKGRGYIKKRASRWIRSLISNFSMLLGNLTQNTCVQ